MQYYLFVPGYYGTSLVDRDSGEVLWINHKEILVGQKTLAMPIPGLQIQGAMDLIPQQLIERVSMVGSLLSITAYGETMRWLKEIADAEDQKNDVVEVPYDWRQEPLEAARRIDEKINEVRHQEPNAEITLISHNMGSAICAYYLRYGIQDYFKAKETWAGLHKVNKVVMAAAPFRGTLNMFRNMHHGLRAGLNSNLLSNLAYSTFPSSYFLLPSENYNLVLTDDFREVQMPIWEPDQWWKNNWGLFHEAVGLKKQNLPAMKKFVELWLSRAHKFHELNSASLQRLPSATPILYIQGKGTRTADRGFWMQNLTKEDVFLFDEQDFLRWWTYPSGISGTPVYNDDDATISASSSELLPAFQDIGAHVLKTKLGYVEALQDPSSQTKLKEFLVSNF